MQSFFYMTTGVIVFIIYYSKWHGASLIRYKSSFWWTLLLFFRGIFRGFKHVHCINMLPYASSGIWTRALSECLLEFVTCSNRLSPHGWIGLKELIKDQRSLKQMSTFNFIFLLTASKIYQINSYTRFLEQLQHFGHFSMIEHFCGSEQ